MPNRSVTIRPSRPDDAETLVSLVRELADYEKAAHEVRLTEEQLSDRLFGGSPALFGHVATAGDGEPPDRVVGMALWFLNFSTWRGVHGIYLEDLYVRPAARGRGHGKALLAALARLALERGCGRLEWSVLDWNEPAIGFYKALGARLMDEWTVMRVDGGALARLGAR